MSAKRKSAFSMYSDDPTEEQEPVMTTKKSKIPNGNSHEKSKAKLEGIIKKHNQNKQAKKMKKKLINIPMSKLTESMSLFANGDKKEPPSKEFKLIERNVDKKIKKNKKQEKHQNKKEIPVQKKQKKSIETKPTEVTKKIKKNKKNAKKDVYSDKDFEDDEEEYEPVMFDSRQEAANLFKRIVAPVKINQFFSTYWEKKPLLIKRNKETYYKSWFSCEEFDWIMRNHNLEFTTNIDIVTYINEEKKKHNPEGRAYAPLVWDFFQQGCSIRLLNPATYSQNVWKYLSILQELFGCCVGSNVYLTPAGTQGFAPHYDDIEAFVLQLEGKKRWRVYNPLNENEVLPRFSSPNYTQSDLSDPIIDVILEAGDLLYFPRGYIHQANACDEIHSLHITVSTYQKNSWGDFLTKLLPGAIEIAMQENVEYRKGLPINYLTENGVAFEDKETEDRTKFKTKAGQLVKGLIDYLPIDAAVDQFAKDFIHQTLPPFFTKDEKSRSIHDHGERWNSDNNRVENIAEIEPDTSIKIIRKNCLRLVVEEDSCFVYHNLENSKIYCEKEPQYLEVDTDAAPSIEFLLNSYPKYVTVDELPMETIEDKISVAQCLYDKGLLVTGEPLNCDFEDVSGSDCESDEGEEEEGETEISFSKGYFKDEDDENSEEGDNDDGEPENEDGFNSEEYDNIAENGHAKNEESNDEEDEELDSDNSEESE
ncbi:unnamed protein product [Brachionus calyciflorus]|uniref:Bifunctional lysine-specific demethylase and histidyl-hydroxylase n=1 Tax=Brachionus calyciflorus TaxID=104777 RepID=A0A813ZCR9_9BILA|nr:unnamed protein product [Brachionus calyciflorus]